MARVPEFSAGPLDSPDDKRLVIEELIRLINQLIREWNATQPEE